jgi:hypothetical protein
LEAYFTVTVRGTNGQNSIFRFDGFQVHVQVRFVVEGRGVFALKQIEKAAFAASLQDWF